MKVRALKPGFFGNTRRKAGDVFDAPDGTQASWLEAVPEPKPAKPAKAKPDEPAGADLT